ncbi:MAG: sigma-70 family RNA polymerase sigma factor [Clostridia bacterium]|nr:sigma-70 family RNA polymerase sigma factor [Clostridia bacterium]
MNYREATDNDLVVGARQDDGCLAELQRRYEPMIVQTAKSFPNMQEDECLAEGNIALVEAIMHFDQARGTRFATYAYVCVRNRLVRAGRKAQSTLDWQSMPERASRMPSPEETLLDEEAFAMRKAEAKRKLSRFEYAVWRMRIDGYTYAEIAVALSTAERTVDVKSVGNALARVRRKLK